MSLATHILNCALASALLSAPLLGQDEARPKGFEGMDADGRIERPELPDDIKHPERWRYTPPGRIVPGNIFERFLITTFFTPLIFRADDVGTGGGVAVTDIDFRNQDYQEFASIALTYTSEGQQAYTLGWIRWLHHQKLENGGIIREDRSQLGGIVGYTNTLTRRFYGTGSRTPESGESSYSEALSQIGFGIRQTYPDPGDNIVLGAGVLFERHDLGRGRATDVPTTGTSYPTEFAAGREVSQLWTRLNLAYDSRDSVHQPYRGSRLGLSTRTAVLQTDSDFGGRLTLDAQQVIAMPSLFHFGGRGNEENPPTDVLTLSGFVADTHGELPYYSLPSLGGNTLRGYGTNRFTDRAAAYGSLEYRVGVVPRGITFTDRIRIERINLALFYDFGTVAEDLEGLSHSRYLDSYGLGLHISFSREASFRIDYGFSDEGGNLTIGFGTSQ
ncbi:MAG: hypothetical protein ACI8QC_002613 [Planctomycetota bacterium]|jgi:hypothetical protein